VYGIDDLPPGAFDIIINATSASLSGASLALPEGVFDQTQLTYDMMYGRELTAFLAMAQASGSAQVADGLGMLVEQAAESFEIWRGVMPRTAEVLSMVRAAL
jgi:shikimate dehydrogenase